MNHWRSAMAAMALVFAPVTGWAQQAEPGGAAPVDRAITAPNAVLIPAETVIDVEFTDALSSETSLQAQTFGLRLVTPIIVDGREVVPAGALGGGEVIDAHRSSFAGRQGRLIVSGRFIEIGGQRARIRAMQIASAGADRTGSATWAGAFVGIPAVLIQGGEMHIPVGTRATARLAVDVAVPIESSAPIVPEETASEAQPTTERKNQQ